MSKLLQRKGNTKKNPQQVQDIRDILILVEVSLRRIIFHELQKFV